MIGRALRGKCPLSFYNQGKGATRHGVQTPTDHPGALGPAAPNGQTNHTNPAYG